jgi:multiple sugar transport system ATP-binding protein
VIDLDLEIADGEFVVFVGPSGCGKTSALRMVAGLEEITGGVVRVGGDVVNDLPPKDRDMAMIFQNYALYPHMSAYENMAFGLKLRGVSRPARKERVGGTARVLGLLDILPKRPRTLSGGQRQRVAMGRAIVREPRAFLMDEPLSNLDAKLRVQMRTEISRIQQELGVTTMYVTHDQTEAMTMGDRVAVMRDGLLQQVDEPQVLYKRPANLFVAGFIGSPAMNFATARVERSNGSLALEFAGIRLAVDGDALKARPEGDVVVGIRPEDMEDASIATDTPDERRFRTTVEVREDMGPEAYVHFTVDAPPVEVEGVADLEDEALAENLKDEQRAGKTRFVARVSSRTTVREGDSVELAVDTRAMHFFDPETGAAIGRDGS